MLSALMMLSGHTLVQVSSIGSTDLKANKDGAILLGKSIAEKAVAAGIDTVVFDRSGRLCTTVVSNHLQRQLVKGFEILTIYYDMNDRKKILIQKRQSIRID